MKYLLWLLKAAIFFTLFAFALNNQQDASVHFFFGTHWRAPLVLVVLAAFAAGLIAGVLAMVPRWWRQRRAAHRAQAGFAPPHVPVTPVTPLAPASAAGAASPVLAPAAAAASPSLPAAIHGI